MFRKIFSAVEKALARDYSDRQLSPRAANVVWVSGDGRHTTIEAMEPTHAKHALALIVRTLRAGNCAYVREDGRVVFAPYMANLVDNQLAFITDDAMNITTVAGGAVPPAPPVEDE